MDGKSELVSKQRRILHGYGMIVGVLNSCVLKRCGMY